MSATLRPMDLGEILDRTFEIYRKRFLVFVGLAAMPAVAMLGAHLADIWWLHFGTLVRPFRQPGIFLWSVVVVIGFDHIRALLSIPFIPAITNSASKTAFDEQDSILWSLRTIAMRLRTYFWIGILKLLGEMIIPEVLAGGVLIGIGFAADAAGLFNKGSNVSPILLILPPIAILIFLFLWLGACFSLAYPAALFERSFGIKAMRRSWKLSKNSRARIVVVWALISILNWVLMLGFRSLYRWAMISVHAWRHLGSGWQILYLSGIYAIDAIVIALLGSLFPIAITLIYYDQRMRHEGYDIEQMMVAAGLSEAGLSESGAAAGAMDSVEAQPQENEA